MAISLSPGKHACLFRGRIGEHPHHVNGAFSVHLHAHAHALVIAVGGFLPGGHVVHGVIEGVGVVQRGQHAVDGALHQGILVHFFIILVGNGLAHVLQPGIAIQYRLFLVGNGAAGGVAHAAGGHHRNGGGSHRHQNQRPNHRGHRCQASFHFPSSSLLCLVRFVSSGRCRCG